MLLALRPGTDHYEAVGGVYVDGLADGLVLAECIAENLLNRATFRTR